MKWLIAVVFWFFYRGICFLCTGTDKKNLAGLRSYPNEVQSRVREKFPETAPKEKSIPSILLGNLILFTVVFSVIGLIFKNILAFDDYLSAFWYFLILGEGLGLFDLLIIDLLWWRNTKRIQCTAEYRQPPHITTVAKQNACSGDEASILVCKYRSAVGASVFTPGHQFFPFPHRACFCKV